MKVYVNGEFFDEGDAKVSVFDYGFLYGYGLFESMRAYNGKIFRLDQHVGRLFDSAKEIGMGLNVDEGEIKDAVKKTVEENGLSDAYVRVTVTHGKGGPRLEFPPDVDNSLVVFAREFSPDAQIHERGIKIAVSEAVRPHSKFSGVKSLNFLPYLMAKLEAKERGVDDVVLTNPDGTMAEASTSNIFFVSKGGLVTPDSGILPGITRETVVEIAKKEGLSVEERRVLPNEIKFFEECFLTNSVMEVVPVVEIDGTIIGSGPGEFTRKIHHLYRRLVADESL